ncbi:transcriptional regulator [Mesorhizobium sp. P5_C1]
MKSAIAVMMAALRSICSAAAAIDWAAATLRRLPEHWCSAWPSVNNLAAVRAALEAAGVEFIPENGGGAGVRLRKV